MARAPRAVVIRDEEIEDANTSSPEQLTDADVAAFDFLDKAYAEGSEAKITIKRVLSDSSTVFCEQVPVDRYDYYGLHDYIAKAYGGGEYRLYLTKKGTKGLLQNTLIKIAEKKQDTIEKTGQVVVQPRNDISLAILEELRRSNERQQASNPMEAFQQMLPMITALKELMGGGGQRSVVKEMMETMTLMREMRDMADMGPREDDSIFGALKPALPALIGAVTQSQQRPVQQVAPRPRPIPQRPVNPNPIPLKQEANIVPVPTTFDAIQSDPLLSQLNPEQISQITAHLNNALMAARFGVSPESIAQAVIEKTGESDMVKTIANTPDLVSSAAKLVPNVMEYKEWFTDLHEWIKGFLGLPSKFDAEFAPEGDDGEEQEPNGESSAD